MPGMYLFYTKLYCAFSQAIKSTHSLSSRRNGALVNEQMGHHEPVVDDKSGKHNHTGKHLSMFTWETEDKNLTAVFEYLKDESVV